MNPDISANITYLFESTQDDKPEDTSSQILKEIKEIIKLLQLPNTNVVTQEDAFFSLFFFNKGHIDEFDAWVTVYTNVFDNRFYDFFIRFILSYYRRYKPSGVKFFPALKKKVSKLYIESGLSNSSQNDESKYANVSSVTMQEFAKTLNSIRQIKCDFMTPLDVIKSQSNDLTLHKFCNDIIFSLDNMIESLEKSMRNYLKSCKYYNLCAPKFLTNIGKAPEGKTFISECYSDDVLNQYLSEGIVNNVKERANVINEKRKKLELSIDQGIMRRWKEFRRNQQNRKHAEIVGDAFRFTNEIKRVLKFAPAALISPLMAIIMWTMSVAFDRMTDNTDRKKLIDDIKDELEIMEEKISIAERKGDDKERIMLIRERQKLVREFERISKTRYQKRGD